MHEGTEASPRFGVAETSPGYRKPTVYMSGYPRVYVPFLDIAFSGPVS